MQPQQSYLKLLTLILAVQTYHRPDSVSPGGREVVVVVVDQKNLFKGYWSNGACASLGCLHVSYKTGEVTHLVLCGTPYELIEYTG
jgi:hypothetical protein